MTKCPSCQALFVPERRKLHLCPACRIERDSRAEARKEQRKSQRPQRIKCLRCGDMFSTGRRRASHFCPLCRDARQRERRREYSRQRYTELMEAADDLRRRGADWIPDTNDGVWDALLADNGSLAVVPGRMPPGATTPNGTDDGRSTYFADLRGMLDHLSAQAASDPWWKDNPHWSWELHDPRPSQLYPKTPVGLRCGDKRGTYAGYKRHVNGGEMACPECAGAKRAYMQEKRSAA